MDNYDKLDKQFQNASQNAESKDFPAMEQVWTRLEDKLDAKVHKKQSKTWKKIAIAASFLLVASLGYQLFNPKENTTHETEIKTENAFVYTDTTQAVISPANPENSLAVEETQAPEITNPNIKEDADAILQKQIGDQETLGYQPKTQPVIMSGTITASDSVAVNEILKKEKAKNPSGALPFKAPVFDAKSVSHDNVDKSAGFFSDETRTAKSVQTKQDPLVVIDGKALRFKKEQDYDDSIRENLGEFNNEVESIVVLPDPLYIINGVFYSEQSLFGKNPTSPYAPLNKQEIESISILQGEKATAAYGEKGAKGVVIIMTKNGKPAKKQ